jgi:two-component system, chemotaxis family, chemotaxis protein CheY
MKHCLVVDNSRVIRKVACGILEQLRFVPEEAEDTTSALDACRAHMPDAILLDVPASAGLAFIRNLRRERNGDHPVVVLCTTENDVLRISEAMSAGADDYVLKPFDRASLADKLTQVGLM